MFFIPSMEQINCNPQIVGVEGDVWEYWQQALGVDGFASRYPTVYDAYKIGRIDAQASPQYVRLRSADCSNTYSGSIVNSAGHVGGTTADDVTFCAPACVIC